MQNRGILIALRAAAIIVIVTGVNDVVASAVPRYEPLYFYLAAVGAIGLLDGVIVAVAAAILSVAFHALLFMPRADALSSRVLIPAAAAFVVAIVASLLRGLLRARRRHRPEPRFTATATAIPLLETTPANDEVLAAIDGLRDELRTAVASLGTHRSREASLDDELRSARRRIIDAERALAASREEAAAMSGRIDELERFRAEAAIERAARERAERDAASERLRGDEMQRALHDARADGDARVEARQRELATVHAETDLQVARVAQLERDLAAEREARAADLADFDARLQTIVTHLASDHEADLGQALSEKEEARAEARGLGVKLAALQRKFDEQREAGEALLNETRAAAQAEIDRLRKEIAPPPARPRILVVHPDADLRSAASATLERAGYEVVGAADGLEALRVAIARQPEIVIAESSMPKMDGRELCQLLKSQEKTAHIRFVLLMRGSDKAPQGELVPDEVLRKPVPVETLKSTLASLLAPANTR